MRGPWLARAVLTFVAACGAREARPTWVAKEGPDTSWIDPLVERAPQLAPRAVAPARVARVSAPVTLPAPPVVLPLVRPRAGGDALALADLALARNDPFDAAAQYRAILARRPAHLAYVQFRLAQAYVVLGEPDRALPLLREAASAPAPEGWAALALLAELRAARVGGVSAVAELRSLAGGRVLELAAYLVHVVPEEERGALLMLMATGSSESAAACELAVMAVAAGHVSDNPRALDPSCRDDVDAALAAAMRGMIVERTITFEGHFNSAAHTWETLRERVHAGDLDAAPWADLARSYLIARAHAVQGRHKDLASFGAEAALSVAVVLAMRTGQTRGLSANRLRALSAEMEPRFRVVIPRELLRRLGEPRRVEAD